MTGGEPRVAVIIPAYESERFISATIRSVLAQTITDFELVIVDDGSQDRTPEVVRTLIADEPRARFLEQENQGVSAARNVALSATRAPLVALLDSDDLWHPTKLERQLALMDGDPALACVGCHYGYLSESGRRPPRWLGKRMRGGEDPASPAHQDLIRRGLLLPFYPSVMLVRRSAIEQAGGLDEDLRIVEDLDWLAELARVGRIGFVPETLADYRVGAASLLARSYDSAGREETFVANRQHARLNGEDLFWDDFVASFAPTRSMRRVARARHYVRQTFAALLDRRLGTAALAGLLAILSDPLYFLGRLNRLGRSSRPESYPPSHPQETS